MVFERLVDGSIGDSIALADETGNTVQGVDVNGTGVDQVNPEARAQGRTVIGTRRGEALTGTPGNDVIYALAGNDGVRPLGGRDITRAGAGNDRVIDRSGLRDKLFGNSGRDRLNAKDRDCDMLNGVGGRDTCFKNRGRHIGGVHLHFAEADLAWLDGEDGIRGLRGLREDEDRK